MKIILLIIISFFSLHLSFGQEVHLHGQVLDFETKEVLPFVNVVSADDNGVGTSTDTLGHFDFRVPITTKNIIVSFIGYDSQVIKVDDIRDKRNYKVLLEPLLTEIKEISVKPGKNPAHVILKRIQRNKKYNNPSKISPLEFIEFVNTSIAIKNLRNEVVSNPLLSNMDKSMVKQDDSTLLLPILVTEELLHIKKDAEKDMDYRTQISLKNNGLSFFNSPDMMTFVSPITERVNFYNNYIHVMNRDFASPLGFNGPMNYRMYITDTTTFYGKEQYKIRFESRNPKELAFNGYFWVDSKTYAVTEILADLNPAANVNIVKKLQVHNTFLPLNDSLWYYKKQEVKLTFTYHLKNDSTKKQVNVDAHIVANYYDDAARVNSFLGDKHHEHSPTPQQSNMLLQQYRQLDMDTSFQKMNMSIYALKQNPTINQIEKLMDTGLKGYYNLGKIDVGPFLDIYRKNAIEGNRLTLPLRTSKQLAENFSVGGYYGYGFRDKKSKYGGNLFFKHPNTRYDVLGFKYWNDITIIGHNDHLSLVKENSYSYGEDNLISSLFQINENRSMSQKRQFGVFLEHDWDVGITSKLKFEMNRVHQGQFVQFTANQGANPVPFIDYNELTLNTRLSFKENYYDVFFHRLFFGNRYPIINLKLAAGKYKVGNESNNYYSVHLAYKHKLIFGSMFLRYMVEAGHIFGEVPFPLLELHRGNESYGYARYYYNMLRNMEYASDTYVNLHSTLYLNGAVLNKIPVIRFFELREVVSFKGILGGLTQDHQRIMDFPEGLSAVHSPYAEIGFGVTNLFRIFRVEYVKRLSDLDKPGIWTNGVRFRMEFNF